MASTSSHIYLGPWINWDHGLIIGSTLTLSARDGGFFNSFLATFITIVGAQLWRILSYIFHQARSSKGAQDGLHHQHQNIFRNTSSPGGAAWSFLQMSIAWRKKTRRPILRTLPWSLLAIVYMCIFGVLSVFQSQTIKSTGNDRLVIGDTCGYWLPNAESTQQVLHAVTQKMTNDSILAANYARACYGGRPDHLQCSLYPTVAVPWKEDREAKCPFRDGICARKASKMDTGMVDSHSVLGINSPVSGRVQYRKVTTCAPLLTGDYITVVVGTGDNGIRKDDIVYEVDYGHLQTNTAAINFNYTFLYNLHSSIDQYGYQVDAVQAEAQATINSWIPNVALNRTDADVSVVAISANAIVYIAPVDDPVFSAHEALSYVTTSGQNDTFYVADYYISTIGCAEQHQICNPTNNVCTPLGGSTGLFKNSLDPSIGLNAVQIGAVDRITRLAGQTSVNQVILAGKSSALRVQETVTELQQGPLPADQWIIEVNNWFNNGLALLQRGIVEYAIGPTNVVAGLNIYLPNDVVSEAMCYSQKIADPQGTISFSVLGVAIILSVGGFIIVTSFVLDTIVGWLQKKYNIGEHARKNWISDEKLQLQRLALESAGMGTWEGHTAAVPTTTKDDVFGGWEDVDPERPILSHGRRGEKTSDLKRRSNVVVLQELGARALSNDTLRNDRYYDLRNPVVVHST